MMGIRRVEHSFRFASQKWKSFTGLSARAYTLDRRHKHCRGLYQTLIATVICMQDYTIFVYTSFV
jgi:hypothetical protein